MHLDSSNKKNLANAGIENQQLPNLKTSATRMLKRNASVKEPLDEKTQRRTA
jgi:hypothetical protein